ncbi:unnamed protein product [Moneuplotes crassus]|uniref:Uncharacterized protein n=1 Tax=Euplotes crassus TaxID=5936 RepID=A0AAD1XNK6_EUPCR|nr:unnamed protein product [Moneuplotes crassus]
MEKSFGFKYITDQELSLYELEQWYDDIRTFWVTDNPRFLGLRRQPVSLGVREGNESIGLCSPEEPGRISEYKRWICVSRIPNDYQFQVFLYPIKNEPTVKYSKLLESLQKVRMIGLTIIKSEDCKIIKFSTVFPQIIQFLSRSLERIEIGKFQISTKQLLRILGNALILKKLILRETQIEVYKKKIPLRREFKLEEIYLKQITDYKGKPWAKKTQHLEVFCKLLSSCPIKESLKKIEISPILVKKRLQDLKKKSGFGHIEFSNTKL